MKYKIVSVILLMFVLVIPCQSKMKKLAQTGYQFMKIGMSARAEALAGTYTMIGDDVNSIFYNPAGLSQITSKYQVVAHRTQWIADISYNAFAASYNMGKLGVIGVHFTGVDYGELIGTRVAVTAQGYVETGNIDVGAYYGGLAYARQLTDKFFIAGQVKYVSEHLGSSLISPVDTPEEIVENKTNGIAFDFGTIYYTGLKDLRLGINIRNFSREIAYQEYGFQMPLMFQIGFAMEMLQLFTSDTETHSLTLALDAIHPRDYTERVSLGAEYWFVDMIALRAGYLFNHDTNGLSAGIGVKKDLGGMGLVVDYAFSQSEYFDNVNRLSLGFAF